MMVSMMPSASKSVDNSKVTKAIDEVSTELRKACSKVGAMGSVEDACDPAGSFVTPDFDEMMGTAKRAKTMMDEAASHRKRFRDAVMQLNGTAESYEKFKEETKIVADYFEEKFPKVAYLFSGTNSRPNEISFPSRHAIHYGTWMTKSEFAMNLSGELTAYSVPRDRTDYSRPRDALDSIYKEIVDHYDDFKRVGHYIGKYGGLVSYGDAVLFFGKLGNQNVPQTYCVKLTNEEGKVLNRFGEPAEDDNNVD